LFAATQEELATVIGQLGKAIQGHQQWYESLNRTLICHLPHDPVDIQDDSHKHCVFGQWLYGEGHTPLHDHPAFKVIEKNHRLMHAAAAELLNSIDHNGKAELQSYDRFATAIKALRLEMEGLQQEMQSQLANIDYLTGVSNRTGMLGHLYEQHKELNRGKNTYSIAMMDLDRFKEINDQFGHPLGDEVLKTIAHHIQENIRPGDRLFRYGGEEFLISMPHTSANQATRVMERLRQSIRQIDFSAATQETINISASIGIAEYSEESTPEVIIAQADQALYAAKRGGRDQVCVWEPGMASPSA